ncbi:hypothetical protein ScPMuIL_018185 [Solemya velum]
MEVLKPPILRIGNRCYRKNPVLHQDLNTAEEEFSDQLDCGWNDETCDMDTNVEETDNGFLVRLEYPSVYFKFVIGKKGETRRRLENETRTQIRIPRQGQEGEIVIIGHDRKGVLSAKTRVEVLVDSARQKQQFTHFLSFPVIGENVKQGFSDFKADVLRECDGDRGLDSTIFQNPDKLHLTIGTLVLLNDAEIRRAKELLHQCKEELVDSILGGEPLMGHFQGLEYMNDDPGEVDVLYAKVELEDDSDRFQILADRLADKFVSSNLMQKDYDRVKLHVTVMNTLFRKDPSGTTVAKVHREPIRDRESFDASNILKKFGNFKFGVHHIGELHISQRYSSSSQGYYASAATLRLP